MTVQKLINKLSAFDKNAQVVYRHVDEFSRMERIYTLNDVVECEDPEGNSFIEITDFFK